jgi:hypothetical protein
MSGSPWLLAVGGLIHAVGNGWMWVKGRSDRLKDTTQSELVSALFANSGNFAVGLAASGGG